jgi:hypothetical protein
VVTFTVSELARITMVVLSVVTHEVLGLAVVLAGLSFGKDQGSTGSWELVGLGVSNGSIVGSLDLGTEVLVVLHTLAGCCSGRLNNLWLFRHRVLLVSYDQLGLALEFSARVATADHGVVEWVLVEAALLVSFIRTVGTLCFTVAVLSVSDTFAIGACPLTLGVAAAGLLAVGWETSEAALLVTFVRAIFAVSFAVTLGTFLVAVTVLAGIVGSWVAATLLSVVVLETTPAALLSLIRLVVALRLTVTVLRLGDAAFVGTGPFGGWVAATDLTVIKLEALEAAVSVALIGTVIAVNLTVAVLGKSDTLVA